MSLDIYFTSKQVCPKCGHQFGNEETTVHDQNITHNLGNMAEEAGVYGVLWHPEDNGITHAGQLVEPLEKAIAAMEADPPRFEKHNSPNGWGLYENFLPWLRRLLAAAKENPTCGVHASR
jgi:hypothetical protein